MARSPWCHPEPGAPEQAQHPAPPPMAPVAPDPLASVVMPPLEGDLPPLEDGPPHPMDCEEEDEDLAAARRMARAMLTQPEWREWAQAQLRWAEEGVLQDVTRLYPEEGDFDTEETFRFLQLKAKYPGAQFPTKLLQASQEKELDLKKVPHHLHVWARA